MVATMVRVCSELTCPASNAAVNAGSSGGSSAPVGVSRGKTCCAASIRPFASALEIDKVCTSSRCVEDTDRAAATPWETSSPVR